MRVINVPEEEDLIYPNNIDYCVDILRQLESMFGSSVFRLSISILETDYLISNLHSLQFKKSH